ncbi:MAG: DUF362 domain-containing protein [Candidatus Aminicenantes bacterium]|nr:DUF362 domain-containing protein [Candidatus Aminicenantes bacterium]
MAGTENTSTPRTKVALIECPSYDPELVLQALRQGVGLLGGIGRFVAANEKVMLKPNCLSGAEPHKNVTTHPAVLKAMGLLCQESGAKVSFGDSPGFGSPAAALAKAGLTAAAREIGMAQADFTTAVQVGFNEAMITKQLVLAKAALETDGIISLAKMKTHGFMRITGAVKNQFGCVPGMRKAEFHVKMPRAEHFAAMLVDITRFLKPRLYVLDGIVAMEGNGPGSGTARPMKVLLLASDPVALDAVFCRLVHMPATYVPTMKPAALSGLGRYQDDEIEICGDEISPLECPDFKVVRQPAATMDSSFPYYLKKWVTPRPFIDTALCKNCGVCTDVCPVEPKAVQKKPGAADSKPAYDYPRCIRCYCCQEMCPHGAITIRRPLLSRLIHH